MANTERVYVSKRPKTLISVQFDQNHWNLFFAFVVVFQNAENCLLHVVHDDVQVDLVFLVALCIEGMFELNDVWMLELLHYLQFSILIPFVLVNFFDCNFLICFVHDCLEHHPEGSVSNDTLRIVSIACGLLVSLHLLSCYLSLSILETFFFINGFKIWK